MGMDNLEAEDTGTPSTDNSHGEAETPKENTDAIAKRHTEQLEGSRKEVEYYKQVTSVQKDIGKLVGIADKDVKVARRIVKEITEGTEYEGKNLEEIISLIKGEVQEQPKVVDKDTILKEARLEAYKERLEEELPEEHRDNIMARYAKLARAWVDDKDDIKEYMRLARYAVLWEEKKEDKKKVDTAYIASTPSGNMKGGDKKPQGMKELNTSISDIRKKFWITN